MNEKGYRVLETVCTTFNSDMVLAVISSRDKNMQNDFYQDIERLCLQHGIKFLDRKDDTSQFTQEYRIAIGWRWIINPEKKLIVIHDSLLPKYRGFSPLVNALINGEKTVGVTALFASKEFDCGDIIAQKEMPISYPIKIANAITLISKLYEELIIEVIDALQNNSLKLIKQNEKKATYSIWRDEEDYHIDWKNSASDIEKFVNAVGYPYANAYAFIDGYKVRIIDVEVYPSLSIELIHVGKILQLDNNHPIIITGDGLIKIKTLQDENGINLLPLNKFRVRFT